MQSDDFADLVILTVKSAQAPLLERLAVAEQTTKDLQARVVELTGLRDRLTTLETKAALLPPPVDVEPLIRDRLAPVVQAVQALEQRTEHHQTPPEHHQNATKNTTAAELELLIRDRVEPLTKQLGTLAERVAVVEVRPLIPGPSGNDGHPGRHGVDGKDGKDGAPGVDGLGFDDLAVDFDHDRTLTLKFARGATTKTFPIVLPYWKHQGIYQDGQAYTVGDVVTWAGSQWHCQDATTTKPGEGSKAWTLIVKRGRDGRDGRDAGPAVPVLSVGRP